MGATCSRRLISYVLHSRSGDEPRETSDGGQANPSQSGSFIRRPGILGVPLSFKARRLSIDDVDCNKCDGNRVLDLLEVCIAHFAKSLQHFDSATLDRIPNELIQQIFDQLVQQQKLDKDTISLFEGRDIDHALLANQPGVTDDWLRFLCSEELRILQISHCKQLTDDGLRQLSKAKNMKNLALDCCFNITRAGLAELEQLTQLESLSLEACDCVGESESGLDFLHEMTKLKHLSLNMCSGLQHGLENLSRLTDLRVLNLGWCIHLKNGEMKHLHGLTRLQELHITRCNINDEGFKELRNLVNLETISLAGKKRMIFY
jgi:hypothetical protein